VRADSAGRCNGFGSDSESICAARSRLRSLGLGLIIGAADDDPSAIGTYAAAGAAYGPAILWTALAAFPMMFAIVFLCSKVGRVTGQGLFSVIRDQYSKPLLLFLLMITVTGQYRRGRCRHRRYGGRP
jgi:Mn2+/Fe2+ NRAMP family transporter